MPGCPATELSVQPGPVQLWPQTRAWPPLKACTRSAPVGRPCPTGEHPAAPQPCQAQPTPAQHLLLPRCCCNRTSYMLDVEDMSSSSTSLFKKSSSPRRCLQYMHSVSLSVHGQLWRRCLALQLAVHLCFVDIPVSIVSHLVRRPAFDSAPQLGQHHEQLQKLQQKQRAAWLSAHGSRTRQVLSGLRQLRRRNGMSTDRLFSKQ